MRLAISSIAILFLCVGSFAAEEKIDPAKLVGKWEEKSSKKGESMSMEFTKDGKVTIVGMRNGDELKAAGTYKLDGDKLMLSVKVMDMDVEQTITIDKLTDDELTGTSEGKSSKTFSRVKAKK